MILFLTFEDVLEAHAISLERWAGTDGIRDEGAIRSAVAQPQVTFDGFYLHGDVFAMGAAYAFHISEAQGFLDGNKRTGALAAITFLDMNGFRIKQHDDILFLALHEIAAREMTKADLAELLRKLASKPPGV